MNPKLILTEARNRIEDPSKWGQCYYFKDGKRCILGAIDSAFGRYQTGFHSSDWDIVTEMFMKAEGIENISRWNDAPERTHDEVLAAFDKAIALCK